MKLVVTYDASTGNIFQHFGQTPAFKVYDIEDSKVNGSEVIPTGEYSHGALVGFLSNLGVEVLICGGIGLGAKDRLDAAGIKLFGGAKGNCERVN